MASDDEELDPDLLAELSRLGEISEAEIEAERLLILTSDTTDPDYSDFDSPISTVKDLCNEGDSEPDPLAGRSSRLHYLMPRTPHRPADPPAH